MNQQTNNKAREIEVTTDLNSKPYVDMTILFMKVFGIEVERHGYEHFIIQPASYSPLSTRTVPPQMAGAAKK